MRKYLLIRYDELNLKGNNKKDFIKHQIIYIKKMFAKKNLDFSYENLDKKLIFHFKTDSNLDVAFELMKNVIGISKYAIATEIEDLEILKKKISETDFNSLGTFKVEIKRREKTDFSTDWLKREIAAYVLDNTKYKVSIKNPDFFINIELYKNNFVFMEKIRIGKKGLPPGSNGRAIALLSGGIDSPVAAYKMMARGLHVDFLTFLMKPNTTDKAEKKIKKLANEISKFQNNSKLFIINVTPYTNELRYSYTDRYNIVLLRRAFIKIATLLANQKHYSGIITGDSLGQVASQTLEAQSVIKDSVSNIQLIQPLFGSNKYEIIDIAREIETYEISIMPGDDTCALFVPKSPVTKPKLEVAQMIESSFDLLDEIIESLVENVEEYKYA